jgi:predicted DNA-binding WGR domain protein
MRYFEFEGEDLSRKSEQAAKFWEVAVTDNKLIVRFGKIGTTGQTKVKEFANNSQAVAESERLIQEKLRKGYVERSLK